MKIFIIILFLLIVIIFIPIPIKLVVKLNNDEASLFLYNKKIQLKKRDSATKKAEIIEHKIIHRPEFLNGENIYFTLKNNKFKPKLKITSDFEFGFHDAATTGLFYGLVSMIYAFLYHCFSLFFRVPFYRLNQTPDFENVCFKLNVECIISLSIAKAIYIFYILRKNYIIAEKLEFSNSTNL